MSLRGFLGGLADYLLSLGSSDQYVSAETLAGLQARGDAAQRERDLLDERAPSRPKPKPARVGRLLAFIREAR